MWIYILMLMISIVCILLAMKAKEKNNRVMCIIFSIASCIPFFVISAIRYDVGTDYLYRYVPDYIKIGKGGGVGNLEWGFRMLIDLCLFISKDYVVLFVISSALIYFPIFYIIHTQSPKKVLSVLIFFLGGFFFQSMNILREYIAIAILFATYRYLIDKKYFIWGLAVLIAFLIHSSSLVFAIAFFMRKRNYFNLPVVVAISLIILIFRPYITQLIINIIEMTRFSVYTESVYNRSDIKYLALIMNSIIYIFMYYLYIQKKRKGEATELDRFYVNIQAIALCCVLMGSVFFLFFRLTYYFSIFQIVSIPHFIKEDKSIEKKILLEIFIIALFTTNICYTNVIHNDEEVLPYKTIFEDRISY